MFLCRGAKSVVASSISYHLAGSVNVATNLPPGAIWTLRNSSIISGSQVGDRGANRVYNFRLLSGMLQNQAVKRNEYVDGPRRAWFGLFSPFFVCSRDRNKNDRLHSPKNFICLVTQTCSFHSSTSNLLSIALSHASEQKQANWTKREPATLVKEVLLSTSSHGGAEKPEPEEKQNKTKQLKKAFKEYGAVAVTFHIGISLISLGIFYVALSSGVNMTDVLYKMGFSESVVQSKMAAGTSTFVLAYAVHKIFAPFRISITLVSVPLIVRYLRKTGLFKSLPPHL